MKANYPVEFMAASLTLEIGNTDKIAEFRREAMRLGIAVEAPSVNRSGVEFDAGGRPDPLCALGGEGGRRARRSSISSRCAAEKPFSRSRRFRQPHQSADHQQADAGEPRSRPVPSTRLEPDRARVHAGIDRILGLATRVQDGAAMGQAELFGGPAEPEPIILPAAEPWQAGEKLQREHDAVGFYLSAHPLDEYAAVLQKMRVQTLGGVRRVGSARRDRRPPGRHRDGEAGAPHPHRQPHGGRPAFRPDRLL